MESTHHALLYIAPTLQESGVPEAYRQPAADISHVIVDRLSIDDTRALQGQATQTAVGDAGRVFVIMAQQILPEAQNALLKLFEEPPTGVQFHLVVPQESIIIPTLRSRLERVDSENSEGDGNETFTAFLSGTYAERLETVATLAKNKDIEGMNLLVSGALVYADSLGDDTISVKDAIIFVDAHMRAPGASRKMLLEELALSLPVGG